MRVLSALVFLLAAPAGVAAAPDLAEVRELYAAASYEEALAAIDTLEAPNQIEAVEQLRALCLLGLGRTKEAERSLEVRDKAMFELLYSSGLRLSELTALDPGDLNLDDATVRVTGKGSKTRIVPVGKPAITALRAWLRMRASLARNDERALFVNARGGRLGVRAVQLRLERWAMQQGLRRRVHPHALRHSFASHVLQSSGDLRAVQEMLGHASIATTQVYTQLDFQHLAKVYDAAHPRARKRG